MIIVNSPNFNERKLDIDMIVLHYTGMQSFEEALNRLCDKNAEVSCHYLIAMNGDIYSLVDEAKRAWHAGISSWQGIKDINSRSIGIEIENKGHDFGYHKFPEIQINSLINLCHKLIKKYNIKPINIVGHSDVAPERKEDPGEFFPWDLLNQNGIGIYSKEFLPPPTDFDLKKGLEKIGYDISNLDKTIIAFKRRFIKDDLTCEINPKLISKIYTIYSLVK